jgi:hypothetical protein
MECTLKYTISEISESLCGQFVEFEVSEAPEFNKAASGPRRDESVTSEIGIRRASSPGKARGLCKQLVRPPFFPLEHSCTVGVQCRVVQILARYSPTRLSLLLGRGVGRGVFPLAAACNNIMKSNRPFLNNHRSTQR